ncbi:MAG: diguanylate cyclase [Actinomycetota bacterium]|nr:diguanylate cyclase [Actinomycetota bacterium]
MGEERITIIAVEDITDRKKTEKKITYLTYHDQLTGLYNRRFFEGELKRLDKKKQLPLSIVIADLNGLKLVNDTLGHSMGDKIIKKVALLLKKACRSDDILARWGGDEFIFLLPKTQSEVSEKFSKKIKKYCKRLIVKKIPVSISVGIATKIDLEENIAETIIDAENNMYKNKLLEKDSSLRSTISALKQVLFEKSHETSQHTERLKNIALKIGKLVKLHPEQLDDLSLLASLHDIGKVAIPESILNKRDELTEKEWAIIKRHPEIGFNIVSSSPRIAHISTYILSCHEKWDGSGYPQGLKGEDIPIISRITFIADAYDAMTHKRPYKEAMSKNEAIKELRRYSGTQFDPVLVEKLIQVISK